MYLGLRLPEEFVRHPEFDNLYQPMSICRRLLNATQTFERESKEGKLNAVSLQMIHSNGVIIEDEPLKRSEAILTATGESYIEIGVARKGKHNSKTYKGPVLDNLQSISFLLHGR
ncbi:hypothetical protein Patl1_20771 [Pistacia atlantica]|uniref:Uncharacterized protein n=1 Tax=Pistacia atlantica TaxID=434234 RepID=A0ACC1BMY4_9ROSI|nr:hypothetical protein Patl1_20771 [Pistacia atlantica]